MGTDWKVIALVTAVIAAVAALLVPLPLSLRALGPTAAFNAGHFVLFAGILALSWWVLGRSTLAAFLFTTALNGFSEMGQTLSQSRSANLPDFFRGLLGTLAAVAVLWAWRAPRDRMRMLGCAVLALGFSTWPAAEVMPHLIHACRRFLENF